MMLFEREYPIPGAFKEVLGTRQSAGTLLCIALVTALAAVFWSQVPRPEGVPFGLARWVLAWLLMLDIAAGAVANFTPGTNAFYAQRPAWRWGFIAIHLHLLAIGWLLNLALTPLLWVWAYTMVTACLVNVYYGRSWQPVLAGSLLCVSVLVISRLPLPPWQLSLALLFMIKVLYAFAVNHYPEKETRAL